MTDETHFCWEQCCDQGPHSCICGNGCEKASPVISPILLAAWEGDARPIAANTLVAGHVDRFHVATLADRVLKLIAEVRSLRPVPSEDERETLGAIRTAQAKAMTEGDHVLADQLDAAAHYVIATRRPTPSREQVAATIAQFFGPNDSPEDAADAVLALFKGGER